MFLKHGVPFWQHIWLGSLFSAKDASMEAVTAPLPMPPTSQRRSSVVRAVLLFNASAIAATPVAPIVLPRRSSVVSAVFLCSASAIAAAPLSPI